MAKKICPLRMNFYIPGTNECIEDKCAWWDKEYSACTIHATSRALQDIVVILDKRGRN